VSRFRASSAASRLRASPAAGPILVAAALAAVAFGAAGGTELGRTSVVEILVILAGAGGVAAAILWGRPEPVNGGWAVALLAAFCALTAISIVWSVAPDLSFIDAGRLLAYVFAFAAAVAAARLAPRGAPVVLAGLLLAGTVVCAYALASRVWPGSLAENELSNRIGQPFGYWNAVGTVAAMTVIPALWLGSRRSGRTLVNTLAYPASGIAILCILLTQSRGALAAAVIGGVLWFAIVPLRLRSLPVLVVGAVGAAPVAVWALDRAPFAKAFQPLAAKESVAGEFGPLVLLMVVGLLLAGLVVEVGLRRSPPPMAVRRRLGYALVALLCAVPLVLFTSVAFSNRGLGGTISDRVDSLTSEQAAQPSEGAARLTETSSSRAAFWREAGHVFADRPAAGTGAATFYLARLRYRKSEQVSRHAHGYVVQTLADLGIVGTAVTTLLLAAWLVAAARTTSLYPRIRRRRAGPRRDWDRDRIALVTIAFVAVVFGIQSTIDWTWFVPGAALMALVAAGFAAGRGPARPASSRADTDELPALVRRVPSTGRALAAAGVLITALLCAWAVWQPERSVRLTDDAISLTVSGDSGEALAKARKAEDVDPLSPTPLLTQATALTAGGDKAGARRALERAVLRFPGDPQTWNRLASFQLETLDRPVDALGTLRGALYLDPKSKSARALFLAARARAREQVAERQARSLRAAERRRKRSDGGP
jgi:O-antigen ligase